MSNVVEFVLRLKDMMSGGMQRAAVSAQRALGQSEKAASRVEQAYRRAGEGGARSIATLERAIRRLEYRKKISLDTSEIARASQSIDRLQRRINNLDGGRRSGGGSLIGMGRGLVTGLGLVGTIAGAGSLIGMGMNADARRVNFETMAGKDAGGQLFRDLTKYANDSIFGTEVYGNAQTMQAFGVNAKDVMPDAKMLGDVSMGDKNRLSSLTLAYSQIHATGRLMGQDLLQLVNAGFNPLQTISEKTGLSMGVLKDKMEDGQISAQMVKKAFQDATGPGGRFFDMTNRIAETPFGKWEALKGQISGVGTEFGTALLPVATTFMDAIQPIIGRLPDMIRKATPDIVNMAKNMAPILADIGNLLLNVVPPAVKLISNVASLLTKVLSPAIKLVGFLGKSIGDKLGVLADMISLQGPKVESSTDKLMKGVASTIDANGSKIQNSMANAIAGAGMESLFESAGKRHGAMYAQALQETVNGIKLTMNNQEAMSSWAKSGGKYISGANSKDPYADFLATKQTAQQYVDMLPAMLRETGIKQGRGGFDAAVAEAKKTLTGPLGPSGVNAANSKAFLSQIDKIAGDQRGYLEGLANGTNKQPSGYEFGPGKEKGGKSKGVKGLSSAGVTHSGPQSIVININKEMIGKVDLKTVNMREGVGEIEDMMREMMLRMLYSLKTAN